MRLPRRARLISVAVLLLLGGLLGGARLYLSSGHAATRVASRLNTLLGVPVRVTDADIGLSGGSSLRGLQVFEADGQRAETPWITVEDLQAEVSALDLLGGDMPRDLRAQKARIDLCF